MPRPPAFPRICIALGFSELETLLRKARQEADAGASFLELRLDYLREPEQGVKAVRALAEEYPECWILATCRRQQNHGRFQGGIEEQIQLLEAAAAAGARAVDVEIESAANAASRLPRLRGEAYLVLSYHNFSGTPTLEAVLRRMLRIPADAYKIVTTPRKPSDNFRVLALARGHPRTPIIVVAMGETGFPTRVVFPAFRGLCTYAAPETAESTAAGQVSAKQLRNLYRVEKLSRSTKIYGVIAEPVSHSISPVVHNRAFRSRRIDAVYVPFLVEQQKLKDFFTLAEKLPVTGFSVTIPHKQKVLRHLDVVDPLARRIGALNTVWRKAGKWRGTNTDVDGVIRPLGKHLRLPKSSVLIVGSGGASRGAAFALADQGVKVAITGRDPDRAQILALARACGAEPIPRQEVESRHFDALVHATPLGMFPHTDECFFAGPIPADVVLDMVYNPLETVLTRRAKEQKKVAVPGIEMFLEQAARQFEIWTGMSAPRAVMERSALEALSHYGGPIIKK